MDTTGQRDPRSGAEPVGEVSSPVERAKHPVSMLAGAYGHPLHPALVPVPIGAWIGAAVFDLASHVVDDGAFLTRGATWLVGLGVLGALAAATVGFLDLVVIPTGTRAARLALTHMALNLGVTVLFAVELWLRQGRDDAATPGWLIVLGAAGLTGLAAAGFLGGELAYRFGVRVADDRTQATGFVAHH